MTDVVVTRRGQTTIPIEIRRKYGIREGTRLEFIDAGGKIVVRKKTSTADLIGSGKLEVKKAYGLIDRMREEDDR